MKDVTKNLQEQFNKMSATGKLFRVNLPGSEIWSLYLVSFKDGDDPVFRDPASTAHNCNNCHNFIRRYGNIVAIDENYQLMTMFDIKVDDEYQNSMDAMSEYIKSSVIENVFTETFDSLKNLPYESCSKTSKVFRLGIDKNHKRYTYAEAEMFGVVKENEIRTFDHFYLDLDKAFVDTGGKSIEAIMAVHRSNFDVFHRTMKEIPLETLQLVRDLIIQGSLLNGEAHLTKVEKIIQYKIEYELVPVEVEVNWCWIASDNSLAKFKNELIGVLCTELAEGEEINKACKSWNKRVDPVNYMKAVTPITKTQKDNAQKFVEENGYVESFDRRLAVLNDIKADQIKHINAGDGTLDSVSIFDSVKTSSSRHKRNEFKNVEKVPIGKFMKDILPGCSDVSVFLENKHEGNMVTMVTSKKEDVKQMFKWNNPYSWTYKGNLAGKSQLAEMVEDKGGRTDGVFRFTHSWNELEPNRSLMDLHVFMPGCPVPKLGGGPNILNNYSRVGWNKRKDFASGGIQDVDYTDAAPQGYIPVENITFPSVSKMPEGVYTCKIHNWSWRQSGGKGRAEISCGGEVYEYIYPATKNHQWITVAKVTLKDGQFTIEHVLEPTTTSTKEIYGLDTQKFHKVNLMCLSPNYWGDNKAGNKHYFFMLDKCKASSQIRGFHNEQLNTELVAHRKVLDVLGAVSMIEPEDKQLSGVGFNATVKDSVLLQLKGNFKRVVEVTF